MNPFTLVVLEYEQSSIGDDILFNWAIHLLSKHT